MKLHEAESLLRNDPRLKPLPIHDELYELTFETRSGRQIALNRKACRTAVRIWIEQSINPGTIGLSSEARFVEYPRSRPRAHLSANRLTGPYKGRAGNDAWYVSVTWSLDFGRLLDAYLT